MSLGWFARADKEWLVLIRMQTLANRLVYLGRGRWSRWRIEGFRWTYILD